MTQSRSKIDSNATNLSYAEESALGVLPVAAVSSAVGSFTAGTGTAATNGSITADDPNKDLDVTFELNDVDVFIRLLHIRDGNVIDNNAGALVSVNPGVWTVITPPDSTSLLQLNHGTPQIAEDASFVVDLSGLILQDGDIIRVQATDTNGYVNVSYIDVTYTLTGGPVWYGLEPNSYDDFGGEISTVARNPIRVSRQRKKGVITDLEARGGFQNDITQNGLTRLMQGFCFADAHEKTNTGPFSGSGPVISSVSATQVTFDDDVTAVFKVNDLILMSGFALSANNGLKLITAVATNTISVTGAIEASPPETARIETVGVQLTTAQCNLATSGNAFTLSASTESFLNMRLNVGEWIFIGDDTNAAYSFNNNAPGYARIKTITATLLTLELPTFEPVNETGTGKTIRLYFGTFIRNENIPSLIKCRTYQLERMLGEDDSGIQSQYLVGAVANEFKLNIASADKLTADLAFVALTTEERSGATGLKDGARVSPLNEDAFNTSSDVYRQQLFIHSNSDVTPANLFAYVLEGSLTINNNASGLKAVGVLGSFDINVGDFEVDGELNCYFAEVAAIAAIKNNSDVGYNFIVSSNNQGIAYDVPLLSLGGGDLDIEKDEPVMLPLETMGAENDYGYTFSATYFAYLPDIAMANLATV